MKKLIVLFSLLLPIVIFAASPDKSDQADMVLRHGHIYTMNPKEPWAESVAIRDGRLIYVGKDAGVKKFVGEKTDVLELSNRFVMPSFIDSHVHPIHAGIEMDQLNLLDFTTKEPMIAAIKKYADAHPTYPWIRGNNWALPVFLAANPKKEWLDKVVPDRPAMMVGQDGHSVWLNSKALQAAGIDKNTPDPPNGRIERDENGNPSGTLREDAIGLVLKVYPEPTSDQAIQALQKAVTEMNRLGITGFQDADLRPHFLETYRTAEERGILTARVTIAQHSDPKSSIDQIEQFKKTREQYHGKHFAAGTVKIYADGVIEANTAALLQPYLDGKRDKGIYNWQPEEMNAFVKKLDEEKFQVHFHAIGDGAVREVLDALEFARKANGPRDARPVIAHLEIIDPADIPRFHAIQAIACFQPVWAVADAYIKDLTIPKIGPARSQWLYPIGSVLKNQGTLAFGSDWPVTTVNPLDGIEVAVTRCDPRFDECKEPLLAKEKIDLPTALRAYTLGAAYANFWEKETGSLEVGKSADLIVLSRDLFAGAPTDINKATVELTLFEGKILYRSNGASAKRAPALAGIENRGL